MKKRPLIYGILCGALVTTVVQWQRYYQLPDSPVPPEAESMELKELSIRNTANLSLTARLRRGVREGVPDDLLIALTKHSAHEMARYLDETRFIEDEEAMWKAAVERLAFEDLAKAVELTRVAPRYFLLEDVLISAIANKGDLPRLALLIHHPISRQAIAKGLMTFMSEGPEASALRTMQELVHAKGKLTHRDWGAMVRSLPNNESLPLDSLRSLLVPAFLDDGFNPDGLPFILGKAGAPIEEIEALTLEFAKGNTALASKSIAEWARQSGHQLALQSRSQSEQTIVSRALARYAMEGGNSPSKALEWAVAIEDSEASRISFNEIFFRQLTGHPVHQQLVLNELDDLADTAPNSLVLAWAVGWLRELSQSDPATYESIAPLVEKHANTRFARMVNEP